ncbi:copper chaperone PCu(A)C [Sphingomonas bacterium]|uniref:copper chaperone PCu(A)C n=1 Tax=Sphingomonas bacterium TaxID=1895847 RepID=UPI0015763F4A|nr:copper chaperone PCu(A)C [Sphingomonas bacterium]
MRPVVALSFAALALAGCSKPKPLYVDAAWVRLNAVATGPAAAYFDVHGGPAPAKLISVATDTAIRAEMHQSGTAGQMATMTPLASIDIPAKTLVRFAPGGRHVMLSSVNPGIKPGGAMTFTFTFADGQRIVQSATVIAAGDPAPK